MTLRLVWLSAIVCSGCTCGIALCSSDRDCGPGGSCDPAGVCVFESAVGAGGGGGAGGGAAVIPTSLVLRVPPLPRWPAVDGAVYEDSPLAWRRGDQLFIWLDASRPLSNPALKFGGVDAAWIDAAQCGEPCSGSCYCFAADLSRPPLPGLRGSFGLVGSGLDPGGKPVTAAASLNVTRVYWRRPLGQGVRATPAIGADGTVYVGTSSGSLSRAGTLFAVAPDGRERWRKVLGRIDASVLVGAPDSLPERVFVGSVGSSNSLLTAFDSAGVQLSQCVLSKDLELEASPAAIALGASFYSSRVRQLIAFRPALSPACLMRSVSDDVRFPDSLVSSGGSVFFVDDHPSVFRFDLGSTAWLSYPQDQWPGSPYSSYRNRGLAVAASGKLVGSGMLQVGGTVFQAPLDGSFAFDFGFSPPRLPSSASGPVVTSTGLVIVGTPAGLAVVSPLATQLAEGDRVATTPALGEGGRLYALSELGALSEWSYAGGKPVRSWSASLEALGFEASPALDCARSPEGALLPGRPGVLYAAARSGVLHAILVDARGIDTTAQWPKYQKDPRNSGRAETRLQDFACP